MELGIIVFENITVESILLLNNLHTFDITLKVNKIFEQILEPLHIYFRNFFTFAPSAAICFFTSAVAIRASGEKHIIASMMDFSSINNRVSFLPATTLISSCLFWHRVKAANPMGIFASNGCKGSSTFATRLC